MNPDAFHTLALAELDAVHRMAVHLTRSRAEAEDLVQETYLRALRGVDGFVPGEHGVRPWLFKILHNALHTRRAKDRRAGESLRRLQESALASDAAVGGPGPTEQPTAGPGSPKGPDGRRPSGLDWDDLDERLCRAVAALPVAHRAVFLMSAVEDMKYREIADVVGVPVGTVMSRLSRARAALAAQLGDLAAERNLRPRPRRQPRPAEPTP